MENDHIGSFISYNVYRRYAHAARPEPKIVDLSSAVSTAVSLPELLREVLLHLDMKTLLLSQRVNHRFRDVINSDLCLRQKLYLAPASFTEALNLADERDVIRMKRADVEYLVVNRLLCPREGPHSRIRSGYFRQVSIGLDYPGGTSAGCQPSWSRMYITQPPSFKGAELLITPTCPAPNLRFDVPCFLAAHNEDESVHNEFHDCSAPDTTASLGDLIDAVNRAISSTKLSGKALGGVFTICSPEGIDWKSSSLRINGRIKVGGGQRHLTAGSDEPYGSPISGTTSDTVARSRPREQLEATETGALLGQDWGS